MTAAINMAPPFADVAWNHLNAVPTSSFTTGFAVFSLALLRHSFFFYFTYVEISFSLLRCLYCITTRHIFTCKKLSKIRHFLLSTFCFRHIFIYIRHSFFFKKYFISRPYDFVVSVLSIANIISDKQRTRGHLKVEIATFGDGV